MAQVNTNKLNSLVKKISIVRNHLDTSEPDSLLQEAYQDFVEEVKSDYDCFINDVLHDVYDEYCEDFEIEEVEQYLSSDGVDIECEDFPGVKAKMFLKPSPLRLVITDTFKENEELIWKAA